MAITNTKIENNQINNWCVYNNLNNVKQNLLQQLLSAIANIKTNAEFKSDISIITIIYYSSKIIPLNELE